MTRKKLIRLSAPIALTYNWFFAPQFRVGLYANAFFLSTFVQIPNGAEGIRTPDLCLAKAAFSQLNYGPGQFQIADFKLQIRDRFKSEI